MAGHVETGQLGRVMRVYKGSDGAATTLLYADLEQWGPIGVVALNLLRACKNSERAKVYRGGNRQGSYRSQAYDRKAWAMGNLCEVLRSHGPALGVRWGWKEDPNADVHKWVLYVDTPAGQVSFHSSARLADCPTYPGEWDGQRTMSIGRACTLAAWVLDGRLQASDLRFSRAVTGGAPADL